MSSNGTIIAADMAQNTHLARASSRYLRRTRGVCVNRLFVLLFTLTFLVNLAADLVIRGIKKK